MCGKKGLYDENVRRPPRSPTRQSGYAQREHLWVFEMWDQLLTHVTRDDALRRP
jgi:hypothetical protein